ncbi:UNVERIFIED_CONTAM: hypothetical protein FKN15_068061 [Acipenser sinensis]
MALLTLPGEQGVLIQTTRQYLVEEPKAQKAAPPSAKEPVEKKPAAKPKETKIRTQKEKVPVSQTKKEVKSSKAAEPEREKEKEKPAAVPRGKEPEAIKDEKSAKTEEKVKEVKPLPRAAEAKPTRSHPPTKTPPPTKAPLPKHEAVKQEKAVPPAKPGSMPYFQCIFVDGSNGYSFTHMQSLSVIPKSSEKKTQSPGH